MLPTMSGIALANGVIFIEHESNPCVREDDWKLVVLGNQPWELYNISINLTEIKNLTSADPERVQHLAGLWSEWAKRADVKGRFKVDREGQIPCLRTVKVCR